jgi:cytochrome c556
MANVLDIGNSNNFPEPLVTKLRTTLQNPSKTYDDNNEQKTWATFTHHSPKIRKVTNLFKQTNTKIAFRSSNTVAQMTRTINCNLTHDFEKSGIYQLSCRTCHKTYVGQASRNLKTRFREHTR